MEIDVNRLTVKAAAWWTGAVIAGGFVAIVLGRIMFWAFREALQQLADWFI